MAKFTAEVLADWNADGDYSDSNEDLTQYVTSLSYSHQRQLDSEQMDAGVLTVQLNNADHRFSKPKGTITGLQPGRTLWARLWYPFDTFVGTDGTNLSAHTLTQDANWTWVAGLFNNNFQLNGSGAARTSTTSAAHINYLEFSDTDVEIAAMYRRGTDSSDHGGFVFRYVDSNNYGYVRVTGSAIEFRKVIGGSDSQIAIKSYTWGDDTTKLLQLRLHGAIAVVLVDGVQIEFGSGTYHKGEQSVADAGINAGTKHGLWCDGAADHTWLQFGGFKSLLHGFIESIIPRPSKGSQYAYIAAHDDVSEQQRTEVHTYNAASGQSRMDQSLQLALNSVGWRSRYQMDECNTGVANVYEGIKAVNMFVQDAIQQMQIEEDGFVYVDGDGYTRFESRGHRGAAPHNASVATYKEAKTGSFPYFSDMAWEDGDSGIENRNHFMVKQASRTGEMVLVYQMDIDATIHPVAFDADEPKSFEFEIDAAYDFAGGLAIPTADEDYTANTLANGQGDDLTSQLTVTNVTTRSLGHFLVQKVVWGGTAGYLTMLKQRADAYNFGEATAVITEDTTSATTYRDRFLLVECLYLDKLSNAEVVAANRLARRKDPKTRLTLTLQGADKVTAHHMMQRRLSDLVTCVYTEMGINDTFNVEGESWTIDQAGFVTTQTLQLREA
tara:strand:- start:573 stop:2570 length:1998 start_codon:yes stop_codon:yes gene_type:complete